MSGIDVEVVETSSLGDRSYLAHDGLQDVTVGPLSGSKRADSPGTRRGHG